jgi:regulator of sigma E protease
MTNNQETNNENRETIPPRRDGRVEAGNESRASSRILFYWLVIFALLIFLLIRHMGFSLVWSVFVTLAGFSLVVIVHEFGHFIFAKMTGMKVEAFSIGFPPTIIGFQRTEKGLRIRLLPAIFRKHKDAPADGQNPDSETAEQTVDANGMCFTFGRSCKPGDTELRIGLIPFGGYVKILGQEDIGRVKNIDDPRSYANKPVWMRMLVIAAGVIFNAILAAILFIIVFNVGIKLIPPVVGGVEPGSPAQLAGIRGGDEVVEIAGRHYSLDFTDIVMAAALSGKDQVVPVTVRHEDGTVEDVRLAAKINESEGLKHFGIMTPFTLTVRKLDKNGDEEKLFEETGLKAGDRVVAVNGKEVKTYWQLDDIVTNTYETNLVLTAERKISIKQDNNSVTEKTELVTSKKIPLIFYSPGSQSLLENGIYSLLPRMRVIFVDPNSNAPLLKGDIISSIAGVKDPNYNLLYKIVKNYNKTPLPLTVLRKDANGTEQTVALTAVPKKVKRRVVIGFLSEPDYDHLVSAGISLYGRKKPLLDIPSGAIITSVGNVTVSNLYDFAREMKKNTGKDTQITWRLDGTNKGRALLKADQWTSIPYCIPQIAINLLEPMERLYKADNPADAVKMGLKRTVVNIQQAYLTLKRLIEGQVNPKALSGPVAIASVSYQIVTKSPLIVYIFWIAIINVFIGVLNFLPMLPFDGGQFLFLIIEKIKGSPVSEKVYSFFATAGLVLIGMLVIYVTFNDIIKTIKIFG